MLHLSAIRRSVLGAAALLVTAASANAQLTIDDFNTAFALTNNQLVANGLTGVNNIYVQTPVSLPIGSVTRTAYVEVTADNGNPGEVIMEMPGIGLYTASSGANTAGLWRLTYGGFAGPVDLQTSLLYSRLDVDYFTDISGLQYLDMSITLTDNDSSDTVMLDQLIAPLGGTASFAFSSFSGIDFTQITEIQLDLAGVDINGQPQLEGDYGVSSFQSIPEPASLMLIVLGSGAMLMRRRK